MAEDVLQSDPKIVASGKEEREDNENMEREKHKKAIAKWIEQPLKNALEKRGRGR